MRRHRNPFVPALVAFSALVASVACAPAEADGLQGAGSSTRAQAPDGTEADVATEVDVDEPHGRERASTAAPSEGHEDGGPGDAAGTRTETPDGGCRGNQVDVNDASPGELERIVHIGSARAEQLEEHRPFTDVRDLTRISGIGERRLLDIVEQDLACAG